MAGEKRDLSQVNVRLASHVVVLLEQRAREAGLNVSEYVRTLVTVNLGLVDPLRHSPELAGPVRVQLDPSQVTFHGPRVPLVDVRKAEALERQDWLDAKAHGQPRKPPRSTGQ